MAHWACLGDPEEDSMLTCEGSHVLEAVLVRGMPPLVETVSRNLRLWALVLGLWLGVDVLTCEEVSESGREAEA